MPGRAENQTSSSKISLSSRPGSLRAGWQLRLLFVATGICRGTAYPATTVEPRALSSTLGPAAPPHTKIAKRAYKRALARAAAPGQGGTHYRGRWQTLRQLQGQYCSSVSTSVRSRQRLSADSPTGPHARYLTVNCGGLSSDVYQELLLTLDALPAATRPHLVAIQETHWREDSATEYNTPLSRHVHARPQVAKWNHRPPADAEHLPRLMDDHALTHLTSWSRRAGPTYICGTHRSVADHVFTRAAQAVPLARLAGRDSFRVAAWRSGGYHIPLSGVLPLVRFVTLNHSSVQVRKPWDQTALLQLCREPSPDTATTIQQQVAALILPACHSIEDFNRAACCRSCCLPPTANWQTQSMRDGIRVMRQHYRGWRQAANRTGKAVWQAWFHKAHKDFRCAGRQARSAWFQGRLDEPQLHAQKKDAP